MVAILAGVASFLIAFTFDFVSIKRIPGGKQVVVLLVVGLHAYAIFAASWSVTRFPLPLGIPVLGWAMLPLWAFLFLYSLALELPTSATYSQPGVGQQLVTTGTYALVRHPGVIWYVLALVSLMLATRSRVLLIAVPVWSLLNIIYVTVQDRFLFPKMFLAYAQYQAQTPMLIPTISSIRRCLATIGRKSGLPQRG